MTNLKKYIAKRKKRDAEFSDNFDAGYAEFKIGVILRNLRKRAGLTQEELAKNFIHKNPLFLASRINRKISVYRHYLKLLLF